MGNCLCCCRERRTNHDRRKHDPPIKKELVLGISPITVDHRSRTPTGDNSISNGNSNQKPQPEKRMFNTKKTAAQMVATDVKKVNLNVSEVKINALFDIYKDLNEDAILSEGIEKFCQDLEVRPEEFKVLVLAWKFGAETMCRFTRDEFMNGCKKLQVDSIKGIQSKFSEMCKEVEEAESFKDLYRFTYKFGLDSEIGQKILPVEMAIGLWKLVFCQKEPPILKRWVSFIEDHPNVRGIPKDTWNMFLNLCECVGEDLSLYDEREAWPSLFDDFVEYENDQTNQNVPKKDGNE